MKRATNKDIQKFGKYLEDFADRSDDIEERLRGKDSLGVVADEINNFFSKNPKAVFPNHLVTHYQETGERLKRMDFAGFHLDAGMKLAQDLYKCRVLGISDLAHEVDQYLADLIFYFTDMDENPYDPVSKEFCVGLVRAMIASEVYSPIAYTALKLIFAYNGALVFDQDEAPDDADMEDEFLMFCREKLFEIMEFNDIWTNWSAEISSYLARAVFLRQSTLDGILSAKGLFEQDANSIYELAMSFDSIDKNVLGRDGIDGLPNAFSVEIISAGSNHLNQDHQDDIDMVVNSFREAAKNIFRYINLFRILGIGMNMGFLTPQEWASALENFREFKRHCEEE